MSYLQPPAHHGAFGNGSSNNTSNNDKNGDSKTGPAESATFDLIIRFSASLPDLLVSVPVSENATTSTLKQRIRASLPPEYSNRRIRLIHAGKALDDGAPLTSSLKRPVSRPPSRVATPGPYEDGDSSVGKGKTPVRDPPTAQPRIYIHCSIGDVVLSREELATEAALAKPSSSSSQQAAGQALRDGVRPDKQAVAANTAPAPRGFDRLLNAGFSASEVQSLRLQFMAIQAHTHTPDTMPSPNTLRNMEDRWLDNSNTTAGEGDLGAGAGGGPGATDEDNQAGALDDMIWGTAMGFFWPIGALMWGTREEGIFSPRRKIAIVIGFIMNIGLGFGRYGGWGQ